MLVIQNGRVLTMAGVTLERGSVLVQDGKIVAVGTEVPVPAGARVIDAEGYWVLPGLVEAHSHMGIAEIGVGAEGQDFNESVEPVTPHCRAIDGINPHDVSFQDAIRAGITATWITPGSANVIGGQASTFKTWGNTVEAKLLREFTALKGALGENPKFTFKSKGKLQTRMGIAGYFRDAFYRAKAYMRKQEIAREKGTDGPEYDFRLEPICAVLRREVPMRLHAHRADDILTALRLAREFDFDLIIEHTSEGHFILEELAAEPRLKGCTVGPTPVRGKIESRNKVWETAGLLAKAGIRVAITTDHNVLEVQTLPYCAAMAQKHGMTEEQALRAITIDAAIIAGVGDRIGSLEVGKDADIAIFTHVPLDVWRCRTVMTIVDGQVVYENPALR
jgi:imidazolonepropionase-like amidohydrolase